MHASHALVAALRDQRADSSAPAGADLQEEDVAASAAQPKPDTDAARSAQQPDSQADHLESDYTTPETEQDIATAQQPDSQPSDQCMSEPAEDAQDLYNAAADRAEHVDQGETTPQGIDDHTDATVDQQQQDSRQARPATAQSQPSPAAAKDPSDCSQPSAEQTMADCLMHSQVLAVALDFALVDVLILSDVGSGHLRMPCARGTSNPSLMTS